MGMTITRVKHNGGMAGQVARAKKLNDLKVGVITGQGRYPSLTDKPGPFVAQVAAWLEFGTKQIAARHIFRRAFRTSLTQQRALKKRLLRGFFKGTLGASQAVGFLGQFLTAEIVKEIDRQGAIDTGKYKQSVNYAEIK